MKPSVRSFRLPPFAGCLLLLIVGSSAARAIDFHWKDLSVGGLYSDPNNWASATGTSGDGPPKAGDSAGFPGQTIEFKAGDASASAVVSLTGTLFDLTSGGYNVSGAVEIRDNAILTLFGSSGAGNTLSVGSIAFDAGDAIEIDTGAKLAAGSISQDGGYARVFVEGGTATVSGQTQAIIEVDSGSFSTGSVNSSGIKVTSPNSQSSRFSVAGDLTTADISVSGSGSVAHAATALASGYISVDTGAALSVDGALNCGLPGGGKTSGLRIKSGGFVASGTTLVTGSPAYVTVDGIGSGWVVDGLLQGDSTSANGTSVGVNNGGSLSVGSLDLGVTAGSVGIVLIEDDGLFGSSFVVTQGPLRIGVGSYGALTLNNVKATISGGAPIQLGVNPGSDGSLGLYGGGGFGIGAAAFNVDNAMIQVGVAGHGSMYVGDGAAITTGPVIVAAQPASGTSDNPCFLTVDGSASTLTIHGPLVIAKTGATARVSTYDGGTLVAQSLQIGFNGLLNVTGGQMLVGSGTVPAVGTLLVAGGGILSGQNRAPGTNVVNPGVMGNVVVGPGGTFVPGGDPNVLSVQGDVDLSGGGAGGGEMDFEIGGAGTAGADYGQLQATGTVTLGGTLGLVLLPGYTPRVGDTFKFIQAGTIKGSFVRVVAPGLTVSSAVNGAGGVTVTVTAVSTRAAPVITSAGTATAAVGAPFRYQITATNSPSGYTASGLPEGLVVDAAGGLISGVPMAAGTYPVALTATNTGGTGQLSLTLTVGGPVAPDAPVITSAGVVTGQTGVAFTYQITASNVPTSFAATGLPDGLVLNGASGVISGVPTGTGTFAVGLSAANASGMGTGTLTLTIASAQPVVTLTAPIPSVTVGSGGIAEFLLTLSAAQDHDVIVNLTVKGSGVNGVDYGLLKSTKKIKAGKTSKPIKVKPLGDLGGAAKKTVVLTLQPGEGYVVGTAGKVKAKIFALGR